jgi:DNA-binding FadR family transcriptional regulator
VAIVRDEAGRVPEVLPRLGTRRKNYSFTPAIRQSLGYALALNSEHFRKYSELRNHVEAAFWYEAVEKLTEQDKKDLQGLIVRAFEKLQGARIQVPHEEHRNMHLLIFSRLENPFVTGILEAYWDAYENVGLNVFSGGYKYLQQVWEFHRDMVNAISESNYDAGYNALIAHTDLLYNRP